MAVKTVQKLVGLLIQCKLPNFSLNSVSMNIISIYILHLHNPLVNIFFASLVFTSYDSDMMVTVEV